jgi:hypothetical protein
MDLSKAGRGIFSFTVVVLLVLQSLGGPAEAQTAASAAVIGTVTDPTGAVIPGAKVELVDVDTNVSRVTEASAEGYYSFVNVAPGRYKVTVVREGFRQATVSSVRLEVAKSYQVNFTLEVGVVAQTLEVVAGAGVEMQLTDATVGAVIEGEKFLRLPNLSRSATTALTLQPLVQPQRGVGVAAGGQVAGARSDQNAFSAPTPPIW